MLPFAGQLVIPLSKANIEALKRSESGQVEVDAYLSGIAVRTLMADDASRTATVQKMIVATPDDAGGGGGGGGDGGDDDGMTAELSVECNVDVKKVGQDANGTISLCVMDNGEVMSSLLMMPMINGAAGSYDEAVTEDDFSQPPAVSVATVTVQGLQYVDEPVGQTVMTAVEQSAAGPAAETVAAAADLIPFHDILVSKPSTDFAVHHAAVAAADSQPEPVHETEEFSVDKLILSLADDANRCPDSSIASLMVSPQLEVFEPKFHVPDDENGHAAHSSAVPGHPVATSCSLTVACNTRKQLRKVLEHRRPASISH